MSHGAVKSDSPMGVVGRDHARRGQPEAKPVTQPMSDWDRESHCEKNSRCWHERKSVLETTTSC